MVVIFNIRRAANPIPDLGSVLGLSCKEWQNRGGTYYDDIAISFRLQDLRFNNTSLKDWTVLYSITLLLDPPAIHYDCSTTKQHAKNTEDRSHFISLLLHCYGFPSNPSPHQTCRLPFSPTSHNRRHHRRSRPPPPHRNNHLPPPPSHSRATYRSRAPNHKSKLLVQDIRHKGRRSGG